MWGSVDQVIKRKGYCQYIGKQDIYYYCIIFHMKTIGDEEHAAIQENR